eukprot:2156710-Pleurochrysis_carterae.AAC.1
MIPSDRVHCEEGVHRGHVGKCSRVVGCASASSGEPASDDVSRWLSVVTGGGSTVGGEEQTGPASGLLANAGAG